MGVVGHSSTAVADYLLKIADQAWNPLTPMQLIKLVYLCHGWMLGLYGRPLLNEPVEAWRYGPVIPKLYRRIRDFRSSPVVGPLSEDAEEFGRFERSVMDQVLGHYGGRSGVALSRLTHARGTPWSETYRDGYNAHISNDLIEDHFAELYKKQAGE